jgi:6-phosphogluconolactonase
MTFIVHEFSDNVQLVEVLGARICEILNAGIQRSGRASMAVSGGSTPADLYRALALQALHWDRVTISLVDERWVDAEHPDSNARMVNETLLQNRGRQAQLIAMKTCHEDAEQAVPQLHVLLRDTILPLDLVILGMGLDGHTASWLPGAAGLGSALDENNQVLVCALHPEHGKYARMSLTRNAVIGARHRFLYIRGTDKRTVLNQALLPGSTHALPVRAVLHDSLHSTEVFYAPDR